MDAAAGLAERIDVQADDLAIRIELLQDCPGLFIRLVVAEFRADDRPVANVIVHIARDEVA